MYKKGMLLILNVLLIFTFTACQIAPNECSVLSKNDGSFDQNMVIGDSEHHAPNAEQDIQALERFYSTDKSVEFIINIDTSLPAVDMPVVEVEPHYPTSDEAKRIAQVLFGDAIFYEMEPRSARVLSKDEVLEKINRWSQYTSIDSLRGLFGDKKSNLQGIANNVSSFIEDYTLLYEHALEASEKRECDWKFKSGAYYVHSADEVASMDTAAYNDEIQATVSYHDIPYFFCVSVRNQNDYKISNMNACLYTDRSPDNIDAYILRAGLCRTKAPTVTQIDALKAKAGEILAEIDMGDWLIDECYVEKTQYGDAAEYSICINAVPVINGVPAIRQPQLTNLKSDNVYASNYYLTDARFVYSSEGELIYFELCSPIDVKNMVNDNVKVMSIHDLLERAKEHLILSDCYTYGIGLPREVNGIDLGCRVEITEIEYNLLRMKAPNTDTSYYYIPGITLNGNIEYYDKKSDTVFLRNEGIALLALNGIDGSIIYSSYND